MPTTNKQKRRDGSHSLSKRVSARQRKRRQERATHVRRRVATSLSFPPFPCRLPRDPATAILTGRSVTWPAARLSTVCGTGRGPRRTDGRRRRRLSTAAAAAAAPPPVSAEARDSNVAFLIAAQRVWVYVTGVFPLFFLAIYCVKSYVCECVGENVAGVRTQTTLLAGESSTSSSSGHVLVDTSGWRVRCSFVPCGMLRWRQREWGGKKKRWSSSSVMEMPLLLLLLWCWWCLIVIFVWCGGEMMEVTPHLKSVLKNYQHSATKSLQGPGIALVAPKTEVYSNLEIHVTQEPDIPKQLAIN